MVICDDHAIVREALKSRIEESPTLSLVGECADGKTSIGLVRKLKPDLLIIDVEMPELDGISAAEAVLKTDSEVKVIMFTAHGESNAIDLAARSGVSGYLLKSASVSEIDSAARKVLDGGSYFPQSGAARPPAPGTSSTGCAFYRTVSVRFSTCSRRECQPAGWQRLSESSRRPSIPTFATWREKLDVDTQAQAVAIATNYSFLRAGSTVSRRDQ